MGKKAIATVMLLAIAAWAEMALAPMLVMHAGHMRPGHEMAADMPAEHAAHHHAEHAQKAGHSCCPQLRRTQPNDVVAMSAGIPACDDPHSCCFRQGPQSVPTPASDAQRLARELAPGDAATVNPALAAAGRVIDVGVFAFRPPPDGFSMILRV
jgi:hypothetical protein